MEFEKLGNSMKNILSKAGEGYMNAVYKVSGIKTLSDTVKDEENYLIVMYLNVKGLFKDFGKKFIDSSSFNSTNRSMLICDKDRNERYYINSKNIKSTEKASEDRIEIYSNDKIIGYIKVEKNLEGIFSKKEKCCASVFVEDEEIAEFIKYDNSEYIEEHSEKWNIDINRVIGGFDLQYKKKGEGLFKKSNIVKWRHVQEEKVDDYVIESVIMSDNNENERIELLLMIAADYANIPEKDKED